MRSLTRLLSVTLGLLAVDVRVVEPRGRHDGAVTLYDDLAAAVTDGSLAAPVPSQYLVDWFGRVGRADVLVRARTVADVRATLSVCAATGAAVIPVGGNTGLVGATVTQRREPTVVLSLADLTACELDADGSTAVVQAGVTIADLHAAARSVGRTYGVDLASRDSATIGGTIATNAGGIHVCAYGTTRHQLLGLQVVLADGSVLDDLRGLPKDNTGYSLRDLICGSEGTLGIVTAARVRLPQHPGNRLVLVFPTATLSECVTIGHRLSARFRLLACEAVDLGSWRAAAADLDQRDPLSSNGPGFAGLVELDVGAADASDALVGLADVLEPLAEVTVAITDAERSALWRLREGQADWWAHLATDSPGPVTLHKYDVTLPPADLDPTMTAIADLLSRTEQVQRWGVFGHVYEASLHIQLTAVDADGLDEAVLRLVSTRGGSLSAEHGVGRDKARWLSLRRSGPELAAMRAVKDALDPRGVLNPGVIFDR